MTLTIFPPLFRKMSIEYPPCVRHCFSECSSEQTRQFLLYQGTPLLGSRAGIGLCLKEKKHVLCMYIRKEPGLAWVMRENVPEEMVNRLLSEG